MLIKNEIKPSRKNLAFHWTLGTPDFNDFKAKIMPVIKAVEIAKS